METAAETPAVTRRPHRKRIYPFAPHPKEMGRRFRKALVAAGFPNIAAAARHMDTVLKAQGGQFLASDLSSVLGGYRDIGVSKWIGLAVTLGLDPRILLEEMFDSSGRVITRSSHPEMFGTPEALLQRGGGQDASTASSSQPISERGS